MGRIKVKIRGIYTTALTKLLLDSRCSIVDPSREVLSRFDIKGSGSQTIDVAVVDRPDKQGIFLEGHPERVAEVMGALRHALFDVVSRRVTPPNIRIPRPMMWNSPFCPRLPWIGSGVRSFLP